MNTVTLGNTIWNMGYSIRHLTWCLQTGNIISPKKMREGLFKMD